MSEFLDILTHGRRLKAAVKELTVNELEEVSVKLAKIIDDRREEEAELLKAEAEKQRIIEQVRKTMNDAGINIAELAGDSAVLGQTKRAKRAPKPPKYEIHVNGERITWTGQGRMPKALKQATDNGTPIESFLLPEFK